MSVSVTLTGLGEFLRQMEAIPPRVTEAASRVIAAASADLAGQVRAALPTVTGELAGSVQYRMEAPLVGRVRYGDTAEVEWATAYELGSPPRQTKGGAHRGRAPKARVMAKLAGKRRARMNRELAQALTEALR